MKIIKKMTVVALTIILLLSASSMFLSNVYASIIDNGTKIEYAPENNADNYVLLAKKTSNKFEFNATEIATLYSLNSTNSTGNDYVKSDLQTITEDLVPIYNYPDNEEKNNAPWHDGKIMSNDQTDILELSFGVDKIDNISNETLQNRNEYWNVAANDIIKSLAEFLKISKNDITLNVKVTTPVLENVTTAVDTFEINSNTGITEELYNKMNAATELSQNYTNARLSELGIDNNGRKLVVQQIVTVTATTKAGAEYKMVLGTDNNFYLLCTKPAPTTPDTPDDGKKKFETDLSYKAVYQEKEVEGKMDGDVFLPPYYENENKDAKKDVDAIAFITSKTSEEIVQIEDVTLTDKNTKDNPNTLGWYYPDTTNKKVIAKVYKFDTYNNPKDDGKVKESNLKVVGKDGGIDHETPNIRWTIRSINYDEKTNADKSITITITYNLPIDETKIPDGWKTIEDKDGGIRRIQRTFKEGEDYDKDVTVKQHGDSNATVTTPVKVKWKKADKPMPQTGAFTVVTLITIAGVAVFAYTRYRKIK